MPFEVIFFLSQYYSFYMHKHLIILQMCFFFLNVITLIEKSIEFTFICLTYAGDLHISIYSRLFCQYDQRITLALQMKINFICI